jgi:sterol desaturase/sphingolipid hydroxylase (fatty acid hydroxylase superfamily)
MDRTEHLRASPSMFRSRLLDRLSRVHHLVPVALFLPLVAALAVLALARLDTGAAIGLFGLGYLIWTLTEYWMHRVVFHLEPEDGLGAWLHWIIHGIHHDHPNDPLRLVMPPAVSLPLGAAFVAGFVLATGVGPGLALGAGFLGGYLIYDELHFWLHHHVPRSRAGRRLREHHMRHHFQDDERGFGISAPYWDRMFGTAPRGPRTP